LIIKYIINLINLAFKLFECDRTLFEKRVVHAKFDIYVFYIYCWVDTSAGGLLVHVDIIRPVVSASGQLYY
jgi:hypothetical protein